MKYTLLHLLFSQGALLSAAFARPSRFTPVSPSHHSGLSTEDCNIRCPQSSDPSRVILPAITDQKNATGDWENVLECWQVDTVSSSLPGIDNSYRLNWEGGFDLGYQYIFYSESFMRAHSTPEPSLIVVGGGIGDLRMPNGQCLRVQGGDSFFSVGTKGKMTAWWAPGTVVSDFYFADGKIPSHAVVPELNDRTSSREGVLRHKSEWMEL